MVNFSLEGKVALVTGAVYGIGFAIAKAFHEAGAKIVYCANTEASMEMGAANYKEAGIDAKGYLCDVTDEARVKAMVEDIEKTMGGVDILANNAGIIKRIPMDQMSAEDFRLVVDIDLVAPFICAKAVIPGMVKKNAGKIINICSEYGAANIQCNGIGPGYIATPQTAPLREIQPDGSRHPFDQFIIAKTPAGRWGTPEDLMGPAVFLASDASNFVNGHVLYVDGGILAYIGKQPQ